MKKVCVVFRTFNGLVEETVVCRTKETAVNTFQKMLWALDSAMDESTMTTATEDCHYSVNGHEVWLETSVLEVV